MCVKHVSIIAYSQSSVNDEFHQLTSVILAIDIGFTFESSTNIQK